MNSIQGLLKGTGLVLGSSRLAASLPSASHFYFNYVILGWLVLPLAAGSEHTVLW